jgi:hypothetical protein
MRVKRKRNKYQMFDSLRSIDHDNVKRDRDGQSAAYATHQSSLTFVYILFYQRIHFLFSVGTNLKTRALKMLADAENRHDSNE